MLYVIAPGMVESSEGGVAILSVLRADSSKPAALSYRTVNGSAMSNDYEQVTIMSCPLVYPDQIALAVKSFTAMKKIEFKYNIIFIYLCFL